MGQPDDHGDHGHHGGNHHDEQHEHEDHDNEHEHEEHEHEEHDHASDGEEGGEEGWDPDETEELEVELTTAPGMADQPSGKRYGAGVGRDVREGERVGVQPGNKEASDKISPHSNEYANILLVVAAASAAASATSRLVEGRCRDLGVSPMSTTSVKRRYTHRCKEELLSRAL